MHQWNDSDECEVCGNSREEVEDRKIHTCERPFLEVHFPTLADLLRRQNEAALASQGFHRINEGESRSVHALERFLDWCNQPTLTQRFEAFKKRISEVVNRYPRVTALYDCDQHSGPTAKLWYDGLPAYDRVTFYERATDQDIVNTLKGWARQIGREYLEGARGPATGGHS